MSDDSKIKITTEIDPTGAQAGGDQVIAKIGEVEQKTEEGSGKIDASVFNNLRSVHHFIGGLMEMQEGGTAALGGIAAEGRIVGEVFEVMLGPLAPWLIAIGTIGQIAIPMWTRATEEQKKKQDDANKALDEQNQKIDERKAKDLDELIDKETKALKAQLDAQNDLNKSMQEGAELGAKMAAIAAQRIDAETKLAVAQLEAQKAQELRNAHGAAEKELIEAKYKGLEAGVTGAGSVEKADLAVQQNQAQQDADQDRLDTLINQVEQNQETLNTLKANAAATAAKAAEFGVTPDKVTGRFDDQYKDAQDDLQKKKKNYDDTFAKYGPGAISDQASREEFDAQAKVDTVRDAIKAQKELEKQSPGIEEAIKKNNDEQTNLGNEMYELRTKMQALVDELNTAKIETKTKVDDAKDQATNAATQVTVTDDQARRQTKIDGIDAQLKNPNLNALLKGVLEKEKAGLEAEGIREKAKAEYDSGKIDQPQYDEQMAKAAGMTTGADNKVEGEQQKQDIAALKKQVQELKAQIAARPDHAALEGMVKLAMASGDAVKEVPALQAILAQHMITMAGVVSGIQKDVKQSKKSITDLGRAVNTLATGTGHP